MHTSFGGIHNRLFEHVYCQKTYHFFAIVMQYKFVLRDDDIELWCVTNLKNCVKTSYRALLTCYSSKKMHLSYSFLIYETFAYIHVHVAILSSLFSRRKS